MTTRKELIQELKDKKYGVFVGFNPEDGGYLIITKPKTLDTVQIKDYDTKDREILNYFPTVIKDYLNTDFKDRQIVARTSRFREVELIYETVELDLDIYLDGEWFHIYEDKTKIISIHKKDPMNVQNHNLNHLNELKRQQLVMYVYNYLMTEPRFRDWRYNLEEKEILKKYPDYHFITRDPITGGIDLHQQYPFYRISSGSKMISLDHVEGLFLNINDPSIVYMLNIYK